MRSCEEGSAGPVSVDGQSVANGLEGPYDDRRMHPAEEDEGRLMIMPSCACGRHPNPNQA